MKPSELRAESVDHLKVLLEEKRKAILEWRMRSAAGEGLNPHEAKANRRDIARIITILKEREKEAAPVAQAEKKE